VVVELDRKLARITEAHYGVFTREQAVGLGFSESACDRRVAVGAWESVHRGVYRLGGSGRTFEQSVLAACLAAPGAHASHETAAILWNVRNTAPSLHIMVPAFRRVQLAGVAVHRARCLPEEDRKVRRGIPVTSLPRTIIDIAAELPRVELVSLLDHVLAKRRIPLALLATRLQVTGTKGRKGGRLLAELIEERRGRKRPADSEPQRILQAALEARALKGEYEYEILLPDGTSVFADVAFPEKRLIVEVDSYEHHSSLTDWARDQARNSALVAMGWRVLVVTTLELLENPQRVAARIGCALAA
jgi:very-short-patch-repair endonuclease